MNIFWVPLRAPMQGHLDSCWDEWTSKLHDGKQDPALRGSAELLTYLRARIAWAKSQHSRGAIDDTTLAQRVLQSERSILEINALRGRT